MFSMPSYAWPHKASEPRRTRANVQVGSSATARPCPVSSIGSIRSLRSSLSRASVPSSSDSARRLYPTTSATRIAASFRVSIAPPGRDSQRRATRPVIWSAGFGAFLFWVLGTVSASAQDHPPLPPVRPPELSQPKSHEAPPAATAAPTPPSSPPVPSVQPQASAGACLEELKASQIEAEAASSPHASPDACSIAEPVRITSIGLHGGGKLDLPAHPLLDCSFALAFAGFLRDLVAPLGEAMLGATVVTLDTGPGYYCRDVDRVSGAKVNPHGKGIAIDVSAVLLADRRRIAVGHEVSPQEALFMQTMRRAGCGWFTTILGPGDPDHADHFHFDILRHGATGNYRICE
jgi:hypothetical protein